MNLKAHSIAAIPLAVGAYAVSDSAGLGLLSAMASILLDVDHVPEYLVWRGSCASPGDFFRTNRQHATPLVFYPLHGWEGVILSGLLLLWLPGPAWALAVWAGWAYHLLWDQISNPVGPLFYFVGFRARLGFRRERLVGPWGILCTVRPLRQGRYYSK